MMQGHRDPRKRCTCGPALLAGPGLDEFLLTGQPVRVNFALANGRNANGLIFASVEEGEYVDGKWKMSRLWNGDQSDYGLNLTNERACPLQIIQPPSMM